MWAERVRKSSERELDLKKYGGAGAEALAALVSGLDGPLTIRSNLDKD